MRTTQVIVAAAFLASALALPANAGAPGHVSVTFSVKVVSEFDFKNGVGIADPSDVNNPCTALLLGLRGVQPISESWHTDLNIVTNLNGPGFRISNLAPPLTPVPGTSWLAGSAGLELQLGCPLPNAGPGNLWLIWSGMNWRSAVDYSDPELFLCGQMVQAVGCFADPNAVTLWASACTTWSAASFTHNFGDGKGKEILGQPWDVLAMKSDTITCPIRHSHDVSNLVQFFDENAVGLGFDLVKNEAIVHAGTGTTYAVFCYRVPWVQFNPPASGVAETHDWKLVLDLTGGANGKTPGTLAQLQSEAPNWVAAIQYHLSGDAQAAALKGIYSQSSGPAPAGQNGFGPCGDGGNMESKKSSLIPIGP